MTYIPDGAPFELPYSPAEDGLVAIGWLDGEVPFERGDVPRHFVDELRRICEHPVNLTRGLYGCMFCPGRPTWVTVPTATGEHVVGHGEIRVSGAGGTRYASPDMIIHYVEAHGYRPPDEFVAAVTGVDPAE